MKKRGPKPKEIVNTTWSPNLAYAVGLLAADGCIGKHQTIIDLTSVDIEQLKNYKKCLEIEHVPIGKKLSGRGNIGYRVQFKNVLFYKWLQSIGFTANKSKTISQLKIPGRYFFDFLRGLFDGDGCSYSYYDLRWRSSFMFYLNFSSGSPNFLLWLQEELKTKLGISGHISRTKRVPDFGHLRFAKADAFKIIKKMYYNPTVICLTRKRKKIEKTLKVDKQNNKARVEELADSLA